MAENPYQSPEFNSPPTASPPNAAMPISARRAVYFSLFVIQLPCALLSLLMLDGGRMSRACGLAIATFWLAVFFILLKRRFVIEKSHAWFIQWGFLFFFVLSAMLYNGR